MTSYSSADKNSRYCGTMEYHKYLYEKSIEKEQYIVRKDKADTIANSNQKKYESLVKEINTCHIPIVIHVVWNTDNENISKEQILSQLDSTNTDFKKQNTDLDQFNESIRNLAVDSNIEFYLSDHDPKGNKSEGITRTKTSIPEFNIIEDSSSTPLEAQPVKSSDLGGRNAWPSNLFLNIWVCNLGVPGGYAQFPLFSPTPSQLLTDGIVIDYRSFGTTGTAEPPYNRGRTLNHEIGHWLNLLHLWGYDNTNCVDDDGIDDTPPQIGPNRGRPSYPDDSQRCGSEDPPLFMNYMDYCDDAVSVMFTSGQKARMHMALEHFRGEICKT